MANLNERMRESEPDAARIRAEAMRQWSEEPAGALAVSDASLGTPESFAAIEAYRYREQPWMHDVFQFHRFTGLRVLEVGVGLGTDHMEFARAGASMTGIDLTPRCIELTRKRCELEGVASDLRVMDAEQMDFDDDSFDVVYSFGVLHHVPSSVSAFREVRRVLRPGGHFLGGLYSRESFFWWRQLAQRFVTLGFLREPIEDVLARIEHGAEDARPMVRLFRREELRGLLHEAGFDHVALKRRHLGLGEFAPFAPARTEETLGPRLGWYLIHDAA